MKREWSITSYIPSHKQFSLNEKFTPEQISEMTGAKDRGPSSDGKCKNQWDFYAAAWFDGKNGEPVQLVLPCSIWDYKGSRWSAFGPPDAFRTIGLLPPEEETDDES